MPPVELTPAQLLVKGMSIFGAQTQQNLITNATVADLYQAMTTVQKLDLDNIDLAKATMNQSGSATSGFTAYDLEGPGKLFYPVLSPLRNMIPRVSGKGGIQAAWRAITAINTANMPSGVSEGNRGGVIGVTFTDYVAAYRGLGYESNATFEAQYAGEGFDDMRKRAAQTGLHSLMIDEEKVILDGNGTVALGTTGTPALTGSTTGGTLGTLTLSVICVALTGDGYRAATVAAGIVQQTARTNADGTVDTINRGTAIKSAAQTASITGNTGSCVATVAATRGAQAYAWFWATAGAEVLGAITTVPKVTITATATGTQTAASVVATDYSVNSLIFDGLITQALKSGSNAYWADLGGATLTADGVGGIVQIDALLKDRWDLFRLNPEVMWIQSAQAQTIKAAVLGGNANGLLRVNIDANAGMTGGAIIVAGYRNQYGQNGATEVKIVQHPYITPGTILFTMTTLPYPLADVNNVIQIRTRQDYYQLEWPMRSRKYEYGVYCDEVLQVYFPPALSVITGIG